MCPVPGRGFDKGGIHIVLVETHFHLDGRRLIGKAAAAQMIEEGKDPHRKPQGLGEFQNGKAVGGLPGQKGVKLAKQFNRGDVVVEGHNGKCGAEEA